MKKTLLIMVMALALLFTQCRKPEVKFPSPVAPEGTTVSMTVTAGPGSKTDITPAGGITWSTGDKLYVGDGSKYIGYLTIVSGEGTPTGTFSGDVTLTGISEGTTQTFHFFYLGSGDYTSLKKGTSTEVAVSFAEQEIYAEDGTLKNASKHHVGYGSASGTVKDGIVTGINVTLVSKVALARFSFKKGDAAYDGALTLSGDGIYNKMTVNFASSTGFSFSGTEGPISLTGSHSERYVMLVPPADVAAETLNFDGGAGTTILENGIEANKFYGKNEAIPVTINAYVDLGLSVKWATCNLGAEHPYDYGDYYAWGETAPYYKDGVWCTYPSHNKSIAFDAEAGYGWKNYLDGEQTEWDISYEWNPAPYGDDKILTSNCDAATKNWGSDWRMPTTEEWKALLDNTTCTWTDDYNSTGVAGRLFTSKKEGYNDKSIFLSAAGRMDGTSIIGEGSAGNYWSSSVLAVVPFAAYCISFDKDYGGGQTMGPRFYGLRVRPVR